jgi:hypothetical protein
LQATTEIVKRAIAMDEGIDFGAPARDCHHLIKLAQLRLGRNWVWLIGFGITILGNGCAALAIIKVEQMYHGTHQACFV